MGAPDLTGDFNDTTSIFSRLFHLFNDGSSNAAPGNGTSMFSGFENFLKLLFSWFDPAGNDLSAPSSTTTPARNNPPPQRTFMGRMRDDFSAAANSVGNFFKGAAFDISTAIDKLRGGCHSSPTGYCLASVENAMTSGGLRFGGGKTISDMLPSRNGSHWAKDLAPVLERDGRFNEVSTGYGSQFNSNYTPKVGDIAVWTGGPYGHTQMFTGYDKDGKQVWISDFKSSPGNWTGLASPDSHGEFKIFRQKPADDASLLANAEPKPNRANAPSA